MMSFPYILGVQHCYHVNACSADDRSVRRSGSLSVADQLCADRLYPSYVYILYTWYFSSFSYLCHFTLLYCFYFYQKVGLSAGGGGVMGLRSIMMGSSPFRSGNTYDYVLLSNKKDRKASFLSSDNSQVSQQTPRCCERGLVVITCDSNWLMYVVIWCNVWIVFIVVNKSIIRQLP